MNLNYALKVKEDLDKLLDTGFIYPIEITQWISLLVIVPKKNGKLRICVDDKLNIQTKKDPFPLPFLDSGVRHEMYPFMDGYNGYNQIKMAEEDKDKMTLILERGTYAYNVMPFGLCNAPTTFQNVVIKTFKPCLNKFMQVFFDDFNVYGNKKDHLDNYKNV
jgi:hypothetical protein